MVMLLGFTFSRIESFGWTEIIIKERIRSVQTMEAVRVAEARQDDNKTG